MSAEQRQLIKTIDPAPQVNPGSPFRISAADLFARTLLIESARGNTGQILVAFSQADMLSGRHHVLYLEGDSISISSSEYGNLNAEINLKEIWLDGSVPGDEIIVSYIEITEKFI